MKKFTIFLMIAAAALCSMQLSAKDGVDIPPALRSGAWQNRPSAYSPLGEGNHMYYSIDERRLSGPEYQTAVSLLGEIDNW